MTGRGRRLPRAGCLAAILLLAGGSAGHGDGDLAASGRVRLSGTAALEKDSRQEEPSLDSRLQLETQAEAVRLSVWLEGGWDGTVAGSGRQAGLKDLTTVYPDQTLYLEVRELFVERSEAAWDLRLGLQRFSWGRLDEYPVNDLVNPWDHSRFITRSLEERKIGVPAASLRQAREDWSGQAVWVPWLVPGRLARPGSRWSVLPAATVPAGAELNPRESDLPARTLANGSFGLRLLRLGELDWAVSLFHGFDPRPVFRATQPAVTATPAGLAIDPGFVPSYHKIFVAGTDLAAVLGAWSLRAEAAYTRNRVFNVALEHWGPPALPAPGITPLPAVEETRDALDYGLAADYRPFEDWVLTLQAQQARIRHRPTTLYERAAETILWANLRIGWLNERLATTLNLAANPEHGGSMLRASGSYVITDAWKLVLSGLILDGPPQSLFGRFAANDQLELTLEYAW
ncbi:MAG: DUF1302 family protein [Thermodesulfobacteriota bacterium]